ncbi:hypothetical protein AB0M83_26355 [Amycolatopsis sp. NPDC051106]|jgi:hypothetical protein|uniref:hypothetical protein n=1 Tax=unclassified Amycolatopsis TaxID=2618356 RepID=UPI00343D1925
MARQSGPGVRSPLWVISLFLGLSETIVTVVLLKASGWIQGLLAVFATGFPLVTAIGFFILLWCKPEVLYAPGDYGPETTVAEFTTALTRRARSEIKTAESIIRSTSESLESELTKLGADKPAQEEIIDSITNAIRNNVIHVKIDEIVQGTDEVAELLVDDTTTVQEFLDFVYRAISPFVEPYTYGTSWQLVNLRTGKVVQVADRDRRVRHGDDRPLGEADILPTDQLVAVWLRRRLPRF